MVSQLKLNLDTFTAGKRPSMTRLFAGGCGAWRWILHDESRETEVGSDSPSTTPKCLYIRHRFTGDDSPRIVPYIIMFNQVQSRDVVNHSYHVFCVCNTPSFVGSPVLCGLVISVVLIWFPYTNVRNGNVPPPSSVHGRRTDDLTHVDHRRVVTELIGAVITWSNARLSTSKIQIYP